MTLADDVVLDPVERCSVRARLRGDPMLGTAFPAARLLLVEQPGSWGRRGLCDSRFDPATALALEARASTQGIRVQAVRRPGRAQSTVRRWALVDTRDDRETVTWGTFDRDADLLELPLDGSTGTPDREPLYLVCAHSKHDTCCAMLGRPVAAAIEALRPGRVLESTHLGGDRFAANVLALPLGLQYGQVPVAAVPELLAATDSGTVITRLLRGRIGLTPAGQAAVAYVHDHYPAPRRSDVRVVSSTAVQNRQAVVRVRTPAAVLDVTVEVRRVEAGGLTCSNPRDGFFLTYRGISAEPVRH